MISYSERKLTIEIITSSPQATHSFLMNAISACMRWAAHADFTNEDYDNMAFLAAFLRDIIPDENQLQCKKEMAVE